MTETGETDESDVELLMRAAALIRALNGEDPVWTGLARLLDTAGADLWAYGPLHCADGCVVCDDDLWMPYVRGALGVARAYLGLGARERLLPLGPPTVRATVRAGEVGERVHKATDGLGVITSVCGQGGYDLAEQWVNVTCGACRALRRETL